MKVDISEINGGPELHKKTPEYTENEDPLLIPNLAVMSTWCAEGTGKGIVVSIGDSTFIAELAKRSMRAM